MNPPADPELESQLRAMQWRPVPNAALAASLDAALRALPAPASPGRRLLQAIPAPVRWSLAACWALSLLLRLSTPQSPHSPGLSPGSSAAFFDSIQQTNDQIHELERELARR